MRDREVQVLMFEKYGLMMDCSKLTERQISRFLDIVPRVKVSNHPTVGGFLKAAFGKDTKLVPIGITEYLHFPSDTPIEILKCPHFYQELVRSARTHARESSSKIAAFKAQGRAALEAQKKLHEAELIESEKKGFERGLALAEKLLNRNFLIQANAALQDIEENIDNYTDGVRIDLEDCIKNLEKAPDGQTSGSYKFILELSRRFTKRLKVYSGRRL